jgi:hypothetical protein
MTDRPMYTKYIAYRADGSERTESSKHYGGCDLFVLDIGHDPAALVAIRAYADAIERTKPMLALSIRLKYGTVGP